MLEFFNNLNSIEQTLIATLFTWSITALGAALVFCFKKINKNLLDAMLGFSAGVMIAASFFSLISPSIEMATSLNLNAWLTAFIGFMGGGILLFIGDKLYDKISTKKERKDKKDKTSLKRAIMLVVSITLHNIPEGMAVGVSAAASGTGIGLVSATAILALGIGIQNIPEGAAVSMPYFADGMSRVRSFILGTLSGAVEPVAAILVVLLADTVAPYLPWFLSFAAGAMMYVVIEELIPQAHNLGNSDKGTISVLAGFLLMMFLDVSLG